MPVKVSNDGTMFLPLPATMWRPITGGCICPYCKEHPDHVPCWDTLAGHADQRHTWVVHYPELRSLACLDAEASK